ncbi:helix-turn-helix domain-containing protein [Nocardia jiangxiensis]|uniref:Helix-turn-helix domain-containing protein n=1 Tax=Nocardia jiangxiensis TaxID=282685 RepID=A0ABW6SIF2_9NOCA
MTCGERPGRRRVTSGRAAAPAAKAPPGCCPAWSLPGPGAACDGLGPQVAVDGFPADPELLGQHRPPRRAQPDPDPERRAGGAGRLRRGQPAYDRKRAGVGQGTLYRRFPTREALVLAVYRQDMRELVE